jgi:hypothetical protein
LFVGSTPGVVTNSKPGVVTNSKYAWDNPGDITYGTPLSETQLNARVTTAPESAANAVPGTLDALQKALDYVDPSGTKKLDGLVLDAGDDQVLKVVAPATANFATDDKTVKINVKPADAEITWAGITPAEIDEGTPLSEQQLAAGVTTNPPLPALYETLKKGLKYFFGNVEIKPGSFLPVGEHTLTVRMPPDLKNFKAAEKTAKVTVKKRG